MSSILYIYKSARISNSGGFINKQNQIFLERSKAVRGAQAGGAVVAGERGA